MECYIFITSSLMKILPMRKQIRAVTIFYNLFPRISQFLLDFW